jgi:hypothetical protein
MWNNRQLREEAERIRRLLGNTADPQYYSNGIEIRSSIATPMREKQVEYHPGGRQLADDSSPDPQSIR